jgi:hypothetical protein
MFFALMVPVWTSGVKMIYNAPECSVDRFGVILRCTRMIPNCSGLQLGRYLVSPGSPLRVSPWFSDPLLYRRISLAELEATPHLQQPTVFSQEQSSGKSSTKHTEIYKYIKTQTFRVHYTVYKYL